MKKFKTVKCRSSIEGWEGYLKSVYITEEEFIAYDEIYGISKRLGYNSAETCWKANPLIQGSTDPSDLRKAPIRHKKTVLKKGKHF